MAVRRAAASSLQSAHAQVVNLMTRDPLMQCLLPRLQRRTMATAASPVSISTTSIEPSSASLPLSLRRPAPKMPQVLTTLYSFPSMEPQSFAEYPANYLDLPLRRDILHRAVVYEGDMTRQGTASTKWRGDVHGSGRKLYKQKGTGKARVGDKKSPIRRGGGVAHGPKPRDFSTGLPKKIYDLAWRTALSYRYRKGELVILKSVKDFERVEPEWAQQIFDKIQFGRKDGNCLLITSERTPKIYEALKRTRFVLKKHTDVDVKDLLEDHKIAIHRSALDWIFKQHSSDVNRSVPSAVGI